LRRQYTKFIVENKYLVEVKPKKLFESDKVKRKKNAAEAFCKDNNLIYKLTAPVKTLTLSDIKILKDEGKIKFTKRYEDRK